MPELPEVEVIKLFLEKKIIGLKIQKIQVLSAKSFLGNPNLAEGQKVLKIWRKAKMLGVDLSGSLMTDDRRLTTLLFHLKMSGQLVWIRSRNSKLKTEDKFIGGHLTEDMMGKMPNSHTMVIFSFSDGSHLYFNDQRKFGWVKIVQKSNIDVDYFLEDSNIKGQKELETLGPEPLEKNFTWQVLKQNLLKHPKTPVKTAIMDQSVVSGVGNIYSNEACFIAGIDPRKQVSALTDQEFQALHKGIIQALQAGIKHGGSTKVHFVDPAGRKGYFLDYAFVYGRDKLPCKVCETIIQKISLGGRGTYFCPKCQLTN